MDGFLLVDKPTGITSHDVVHHVRRILGVATRRTMSQCRVGHAGTLDPFATGLLILGLGKATKQLGRLLGLDKTYEAELMLGATSDTFDRDGVITAYDKTGMMNHAATMQKSDMPEGGMTPPLRENIERVLDQFRGGYEQRAPLHSAKKLGGKKLYDLARAGQATEEMRPTKKIILRELTIVDYAFPLLRIHVHCSSGTYIRSLADDIGRALGIGAYLTELRRTSIGTYPIENAASLENLKTTEDIKARLFPI